LWKNVNYACILQQKYIIMKAKELEQEILKALEDVHDPEIKALSVVDLGIISEIKADEEGNVRIKMTPTFSGCPAILIMHAMIKKRASEVEGTAEVNVIVDKETQWNSNKITEKGRKAIKKFGLAPPPKYENDLDVSTVEKVECPYCDSQNTKIDTPFGPTLCRSMHYCNDCRQSFEQFKPL
jgi:ring-1,2-phenylacetyl-CoA epoxidase subunit PaaD